MHYTWVTFFYGIVTLAVFLWLLIRGSRPLMGLGSVTFCGWMFAVWVRAHITPTTEQLYLAMGDFIQAAAFLLFMHKPYGMKHKAVMALIFFAMISLHFMVAITPDANVKSYHLALNMLYLGQLGLLCFMMGTHELVKGRARHLDSLNAGVVSGRSGVV